jgi:hypothetical protein
MRIGRTGYAALLAAAAAGSAAAGTGWTTVGGAKAGSGAGTVTAELRWQAEFRELLVCADGGAVKLAGATLRLRDGSARTVKLRARIDDGACGDPISVGRKELASVEVAYDAGQSDGVKLSVMGR